ncbi:hypothetical protein IFM89_024390 [Coptis chinensis]|uniref:Regulator of telomere elongation helicase 1 homolog n=1 Tax=Coptis chinensis TaxID=261450 RepID=A0A835IFC1_9MAGN|nr:hypothetical protein IFM89_024390 [Coptis chinensis]
MPIYNIRGIDVDFPYEAYDCQIVYMEKVIQSLQERCNALLESPTGTGKTLCLLCATLAWRRSLGEFSTNGRVRMGSSQRDDLPSSQQSSQQPKYPTIVYSTAPKMVVIGSREQLCIHDDVKNLRGRAQTNACHFVCKKRKCSHHSSVSGFVKNNSNLGDDPIDIEDLVNIGRSQGPCPYYLSRELHKVVDILFAPYNYLIDRGNRKSLNIKWEDSVLIFDEAHNLESICADAASFDLPSGLLTACISEAKKCVDLSAKKRSMDKFIDKSANPESFAILKALLFKLEKRIAEVSIESKELGFTQPGPYIYELLADLNITQDTTDMLIDTLTKGVTLLEEGRLETLADILHTIFNKGDKSHASSYRVHVQEADTRSLDVLKGKASRTLSWWCFNPGIAMEEFSKMGVGSIILTSGTLSPLDSFAKELKLDFPIRLENPHVISSNQIWAGVLPIGPSGCAFNSSYRNRDSLAYRQDLGNAIANFARIVPDGLLVFFPSYYLLDQCIACWKNLSQDSSTNTSTIWERICKHKQPVVEPKQSSLFSSSIEDYMTKLSDISTSGAVFFAVCRGKVSEGLDFADHTGRAVVITGMPFPTWNDPKVRLKRDFLDHPSDSPKKELKALTGGEWYNQQASRAVNQAVGRVIRHRHDYGAIIFCDERFSHAKNQHQMSIWLQPYIKCYSNFGEVAFTLTRFFRDILKSGSKLKESVRSDVKISLPQEKLSSAKALTSLATAADENLSMKPLSSAVSASRTSSCNKLEEILPANRSMLTPLQNNPSMVLKHSRELFGKVNKLWTPDPNSKEPHCQKRAVIDLTSESELTEQLRTEELNVPSSSKKSKSLKIDPGIMLRSEKHLDFDKSEDIKKGIISSYSSSLKHGSRSQLAQCSLVKSDTQKSDGNQQNAEIFSVVMLEDNVTSRSAFEFPAQKDYPSVSMPCNEESKGSAFLSQVKEKLTTVEYREFVGYMKALKSALKTETIKINQVIESIATLFCSPERQFLLKRFKDYIPVKYQPMYEQHLRVWDAKVDKYAEGTKEVPDTAATKVSSFWIIWGYWVQTNFKPKLLPGAVKVNADGSVMADRYGFEEHIQAEEARDIVQTQWERLAQRLSLEGLTLRTPSTNATEDEKSEDDPVEELCQQIILVRAVSTSVGRETAKAEAEIELDSEIKKPRNC